MTRSILTPVTFASAQEMYKKGLERLPRILALQRSQADIRANQASNRAQVAKNANRLARLSSSSSAILGVGRPAYG
ncbi:MAG: hypothetical protein E5V93_09705 [Mesorhizobium sp.]|nr:MAG: hypothetical protein E5V93_09705 [Mesorhizobium sp.]